MGKIICTSTEDMTWALNLKQMSLMNEVSTFLNSNASGSCTFGVRMVMASPSFPQTVPSRYSIFYVSLVSKIYLVLKFNKSSILLINIQIIISSYYPLVKIECDSDFLELRHPNNKGIFICGFALCISIVKHKLRLDNKILQFHSGLSTSPQKHTLSWSFSINANRPSLLLTFDQFSNIIRPQYSKTINTVVVEHYFFFALSCLICPSPTILVFCSCWGKYVGNCSQNIKNNYQMYFPYISPKQVISSPSIILSDMGGSFILKTPENIVYLYSQIKDKLGCPIQNLIEGILV